MTVYILRVAKFLQEYQVASDGLPREPGGGSLYPEPVMGKKQLFTLSLAILLVIAERTPNCTDTKLPS